MWILETLLVVVPIGCGSFVSGLCFLFSTHLDKEESWLLHFNCIVYISVSPCPFFKLQWVSQESVIVTFPSHVHL